MNTQVAEILELSISERLKIVEDIWDSIAAEREGMPLTDDIRDELDRRLQAFEENPEQGVSWDVLNDRLAKSR